MRGEQKYAVGPSFYIKVKYVIFLGCFSPTCVGYGFQPFDREDKRVGSMPLGLNYNQTVPRLQED